MPNIQAEDRLLKLLQLRAFYEDERDWLQTYIEKNKLEKATDPKKIEEYIHIQDDILRLSMAISMLDNEVYHVQGLVLDAISKDIQDRMTPEEKAKAALIEQQVNKSILSLLPPKKGKFEPSQNN